jgi:hypothetical protein
MGVPHSNSASHLPTTGRRLAESLNELLGRLAAANEFPLEGDQRDAWQQEIEILHNAVTGLDGTIYFEFDI